MLTYLHVKNIGLIDEMEIDFEKGLSVMTGETGAGKSMIIGSINAVLGSKIPKDFIRRGEEQALIEAVFSCRLNEVKDCLNDMDIEAEDQVILSRKISQNGRSIFKINGETVTALDVKKISKLLIDLHSQHEHQSLLEAKNHINLLDRYIGSGVLSLKKQLEIKHKEYNALRKEIEEYSQDDETRKREISFLEYEINEIEAASLREGEDTALEQAYKKQSNIRNIQELLANAWDLLFENASYSSKISQIEKASEFIFKAKQLDDDLDENFRLIEQIEYMMTDLRRDLEKYTNQLVFDEEELEYTRKRIDLINSLKMKHGNSIEAIMITLDAKIDKLEKLVNHEERLNALEKQKSQIFSEMKQIAEKLSDIRKINAEKLSDKITETIKELNLENSIFDISFKKKEEISLNGWDEIEFMISTNKGEEIKPLVMIASGGELSRIMLSIKTIFADCDEIGTMIFDEIDTGISGRTAQRVAEKMIVLSKERQIICITHLPQIAAMADWHYLIEKNVNNEDITLTTMKKLKEEDIPKELSRLIGGAKITEATYLSAVEMKKMANDIKNKIK